MEFGGRRGGEREPGDERAASGGQDSGGKGGGATSSSGVTVGKWEKGIVATTAADVCRVSQPCGDFQLAAVGRRSAQSETAHHHQANALIDHGYCGQEVVQRAAPSSVAG